jgi:hypothetical protein
MSKRAVRASSMRAAVAATLHARAAVRAAVVVLSLASAAAGCTSSDDDEAFADFSGTWKLTADKTQTNNFRLTCPDIPFDSNDFQLFTDLRFEPGTVTDLYEMLGPSNCQFGFNAVPKLLAMDIVTPDPFTGLAPTCALDLGDSQDPATGAIINTQMIFNPATWRFNLQPTPKGKAPIAFLKGHAEIDLTDINTDLNPPQVVGTTRCTFDIQSNYDKVSQL